MKLLVWPVDGVKHKAVLECFVCGANVKAHLNMLDKGRTVCHACHIVSRKTNPDYQFATTARGKKISAALKGRAKSDIAKYNMSKAAVVRCENTAPEERLRVSMIGAIAAKKALTGVPKTKEHAERTRESAILRWKNPVEKELQRERAKEYAPRSKNTCLNRYGKNHYKQISPVSIDYWIARGYDITVAKMEVSKLQTARSAKRKNYNSPWSISYWIAKGCSREEAVRRISVLQSANSAKSTVTISECEKHVLNALEKFTGLVFARQEYLEDRFTVDGYNSDYGIVVEVFGTFWHCHRSLFPDTSKIHPSLGWPVMSKRCEDAGRIRRLRNKGYKVFLVWDTCDLAKRTAEVARLISAHVEKQENYTCA